MNRTVMFVTFSTLAALGIIGTALILLLRPDATATFTALLVQVLGLVTVAAATFYGLGKANEKLEKVERQTNGTLSELRAENDRLTRENIELAKKLPPEDHDGRSGV
ncbi:hypothetical protein [Microbacterium invictum]|uniref:Lipopolysaccharide assembly protein A domain-containing protein n=1 Tax=Microbacterium invictum TaxID=515415 RepID=A0ABZ0VH53_9MICO|nr:hypothetical protein [Microbacterium invictum]WQB71956.1 hypothetical protein T9R20_08435 [Microbacterium invictum]